jgi:hypothetical protein
VGFFDASAKNFIFAKYSEPATINPILNPNSMDLSKTSECSPSPATAEEYKGIAWAQERALKLVETGKLVEAVRNLITDLQKDSGFSGCERRLIWLVGENLALKPNLTAQEVIDFIKGRCDQTFKST